MKSNLSFPALLLSFGLIISAIIITMIWKSNYRSNQTITVTGSAKLDITSDFGKLSGTLSSSGSTLQEAYQNLQGQKPALLGYLARKGFPEDKINFSPAISYPTYQTNAQGMSTQLISGYNYTQNIEIEGSDVNLIKSISLDITSLANNGVSFQVNAPEYYYTQLAGLKIQIQEAAAKDALQRAQKIAAATDRSISNMMSADMGVLQITPKYSNETSDMGVNDVSSIEKEITAVVRASFQIE